MSEEEEKLSEVGTIVSNAMVVKGDNDGDEYRSDSRQSSEEFPDDDDAPETQAIVEAREAGAMTVPFLRAVGRKIGINSRKMANVRVKRAINEAVLGVEAAGVQVDEEQFEEGCEEERMFLEGGANRSWAQRMEDGETFDSFGDEEDDYESD